ncbi:MAG: chemotaxis protein CheW [Nitrospirota bacterium]|nr:chemotaxis protein CheW [Nitrospirota bacterium]
MSAITQIQHEDKIVCFTLAHEMFGVPISMVHEIIRPAAITAMPRSPDYVKGVLNLRGKIIPVVDLRKRFGLEEAEETKETRIVVVGVGGLTVGMVVDGVSEVLRIRAEDIEPPSPIIATVDSEYIRGVGKVEGRLIILLDTEMILSHQDKEHLSLAANDSVKDLIE